jgi:helicase required for RNAi-mediated heterochromatin assembly 1
LANHIVELDLEIDPPEYLKEHAILDLSSLILPGAGDDWSLSVPEETLQNVDVLKGFPTLPRSGMDASQTSALERMITKRVAVVQGPPGTGKTFTSVSALKVLLNNLQPDNPPVIIAAQTNHALDQLIKHVQGFEENIVRLGGRCDKENVDIIKRTIHELRKSTTNGPSGRRELKFCRMQLEQHIDKIQRLMSPLLASSSLTDDMLMNHGLITEGQKDSLYESGWCEANQSQANTDSNDTAISTCK